MPIPRPAAILCDDGMHRPAWAAHDPVLRDYYDNEWGRPVRDEKVMFELLSLEVFQSGLSWSIILHKRPAFRAAFDAFDPKRVADFGPEDVARLMADGGIVRNRRKIKANIQNAQATVVLRADSGLGTLVWSFRPADRQTSEVVANSLESKALAAALLRVGFTFVGPTTMYSLMEVAGILVS